jgi:hypothetical protein
MPDWLQQDGYVEKHRESSQNKRPVDLTDRKHNTLPIHEASSSVIVTVLFTDCMAGSATAENPRFMPGEMVVRFASTPIVTCSTRRSH